MRKKGSELISQGNALLNEIKEKQSAEENSRVERLQNRKSQIQADIAKIQADVPKLNDLFKP